LAVSHDKVLTKVYLLGIISVPNIGKEFFMKKSIIKVIALTLMAAMVCVALVSCGKMLSGEYEAEVDAGVAKYSVTYKFSGSKVEVDAKATVFGKVVSESAQGKYEIKDGEITLTFDEETSLFKNGTFTFEETEKGVKIGMVEYKKVEK